METKDKIYFLRFDIANHPLIANNFSFSTLATARVSEKNIEALTHLKSRLWMNNVIAINGRNATGKTTILRLLIGLLNLTTQNKSIDETELKDVLMGNEDIEVAMYFYSTKSYIYKDTIIFTRDADGTWIIKNETIHETPITANTSKSKLFEFNDKTTIYQTRSNLKDIERQLLSNKNSLFRLVSNQYVAQKICNTLLFTDINAVMYKPSRVPTGLLEFLDPTIEYFQVDLVKNVTTETSFYRLKFKGNDEVFEDSNFATLIKYLSSGTAKAITLFGYIVEALRNGGILFIDEIENHFNHAIIREIIKNFADDYFNTTGATLIFTTHFSELLDDLSRTDGIYLMSRDDKDCKIKASSYFDLNICKDLERKEVFDSGYNGLISTPSYEAIVSYEQSLKEILEEPIS